MAGQAGDPKAVGATAAPSASDDSKAAGATVPSAMAKRRQRRRNARHVSFGGVPRVDLLPNRQRALLLHERVMPRLLLAIIASAATAALIWAVVLVPEHFADQELAAQQNTTNELLAELESYSDVQAVLNDAAGLQELRKNLGASEVLFVDVHEQLRSLLPEGASLSRFAAKLVAGGESFTEASSVREGDALCAPDTVSISAQIDSDGLLVASDTIAALTGLTGYQCATVTEFSGSSLSVMIGLGPDALSARFSQEVES